MSTLVIALRQLNAAELKMVANQKQYQLNVAFIYTGKPNPPFGTIQQSVKKVLAKLINEITA